MFLKTPLLAVAGLLLFAGSAVAATPPSFVQGPGGDASPVAGAETVERLCTGTSTATATRTSSRRP